MANIIVSLGSKEAPLTQGHGALTIVAHERVDIPPQTTYAYPTQFSVELEQHEMGLIQPCFKLASKYPYIINGTVIHPNYQGPLTVSIINLSPRVMEVRPGDHIAQIVFTTTTQYSVTEQHANE